MEFSSFFFHLLFLGLIFQLSNTIVSSTKVEIPAQNASTDKLNSLVGQMDVKNANIGKRLVQQRIKRDTDDEDTPEDVIHIDHRRSGCIDREPRSQGNSCDASYAFATIAFYEWLHCQKDNRLKKFSEQFIIDCGHTHGNSGCAGGHPVKAMRFGADFGLALRANYPPYTGIVGQCPSGNQLRNLRRLSIDQTEVTQVPLDQLAAYLVYGPIIVIIETNDDFYLYPGGVDDNEGHSPANLHAMLLIGHGREDGEDYWLFRNSDFTASRSDGIYKLNKNVDCLRGDFGIGVNSFIL